MRLQKVRTVKLKKGQRVIRMWEHVSWGNNVEWFDFRHGQLVGWLTTLPKKKDYVLEKMDSGRIAVFRVVSVEPQPDPKDMFFATLKDLGYLS